MPGYTPTVWVDGAAPGISKANLDHLETQYGCVKTELQLAGGASDIQPHGSNIVAGTVADTQLGNRTISDAAAPTGDTGTLTTLLGWLANMTKQMTGEASWRTAPDTTFVAAKAHIDATTAVHGAVSTATALKIAIRDASARLAVADGAAAGDCATKGQLDAHNTTTGVHGVGASTIESASGSQGKVDTHAGVYSAHGAVSAATGSRIVLRDAAGRAQFVDPSADQDAATKKYTVDTYIPKTLFTTQGDIAYATAASTWTRLGKGTARQALLMNAGATAPEWGASLASLLAVQGDIPYASAANTPAALAKGTAYQALTMNAGATAPQWSASLQSLLTAQGDIVYASGANTPARLPKGTAYQALLMNAGATAPEWSGVFHETTGHVHDGTAGDGPKIDPANLSWVPARIATGSYTGDGTFSRTISVGFAPKLVVVIANCIQDPSHPDSGDLVIVPSLGAIHHSAPGVSTTNQPYISGTGFVVSTNALAPGNVDTVPYYWTAIG